MQNLPPTPPIDLLPTLRSARPSPGRGGRIWLLRPVSQGGPPNSPHFKAEGATELMDARAACAAAYKDVQLEQVRYSPTERAGALAQAIAAVTGAQLQADEGLEPWKLGEWQAYSRDQVRSALAMESDAFWKDPANWRPPGGESHAEFEERIWQAFERSWPKGEGSTLLLSHGEALRTITGAALGIPIARLSALHTAPGLAILLHDHANGWTLERTGARPNEQRASDLQS